MPTELESQIALGLIRGVGDRNIKNLISYCGSAKKVFQTTKGKLMKIPGLGHKIANEISSANPFKEVASIIKKCEQLKIDIIPLSDKRYPRRLTQQLDAPNILYFKGKGLLNPKRSVAIVGTRNATQYGKSITEKIVKDLSSLDVSIVSGLAYGIDIQAHKTCLNMNVPTFAVLAGGLDKIFPSVHKKYTEEMLADGGILSENIPGTKPEAHLFPHRNRIIAGMADAVIVVEASDRGGALITAQQADSYHKTMFAVPGELGKKYSYGTNKLIAKQQALIYTGIEDVMYHMNWSHSNEELKESTTQLPNLEGDEKKVYETLYEYQKPMEIDRLSIVTQIPINQISSVLLHLEFRGILISMPGKKYGLVK